MMNFLCDEHGEVGDRILQTDDILTMFPIGRTTLWRLEKAKLFPNHFKIGGKNCWLESEVVSWMENSLGLKP